MIKYYVNNREIRPLTQNVFCLDFNQSEALPN